MPLLNQENPNCLESSSLIFSDKETSRYLWYNWFREINRFWSTSCVAGFWWQRGGVIDIFIVVTTIPAKILENHLRKFIIHVWRRGKGYEAIHFFNTASVHIPCTTGCLVHPASVFYPLLASSPKPQLSRNTFLLETSFCATSFGVLQALRVLDGPGRVMSHNLWREIVCFVTGLTAGVTQVTYTDAGHVFCHASQMHTWYAVN